MHVGNQRLMVNYDAPRQYLNFIRTDFFTFTSIWCHITFKRILPLMRGWPTVPYGAYFFLSKLYHVITVLYLRLICLTDRRTSCLRTTTMSVTVDESACRRRRYIMLQLRKPSQLEAIRGETVDSFILLYVFVFMTFGYLVLRLTPLASQ